MTCNFSKQIENENGDKDDLGDRQSRAPLLLKNIKAYASIAVDIRMEDLCLKRYLKREHTN